MKEHIKKEIAHVNFLKIFLAFIGIGNVVELTTITPKHVIYLFKYKEAKIN